MLRFFQSFTFPRLFAFFLVSVVAFFALTFTVGFAWSWFFLLYIIFFVVRYVLLGTVGTAAMKLYDKDFDGAKKWLSYTWKPEWLRMGMKGFYYFLMGAINQNEGNLKDAEKNLKAAIKAGLPDNDSMVMANLNIAAMYINTNRKMEAKEYLTAAKKLKSTNPMIQEQLKNAEAALTAPTMNMRMHQQMMQAGKGGFRKAGK